MVIFNTKCDLHWPAEQQCNAFSSNQRAFEWTAVAKHSTHAADRFLIVSL